ncbi:MAG: YggT family protein [Sulfurovum sp.]|nr:YggT family protein [Sulfurovum sp.]
MIELFCWVLNAVVSIYIWILIIAVLMTYFHPNPYNQAVQFIYRITEPVFRYARRYLSFLIINGIDFSPIAVILALQFVPRIVCSVF